MKLTRKQYVWREADFHAMLNSFRVKCGKPPIKFRSVFAKPKRKPKRKPKS